MFGYMGFGMQSHVYKKRARKPFSKRSKIVAFVPLHTNLRIFKLRKRASENLKVNGIDLILAVLISLFLIFSFVNNVKRYTASHYLEVQTKVQERDSVAFNFLINSGISRLKQDNATGAYSEFKLAYQIDSSNKELYQLLTETLSALCTDDVKYCEELDDLLNQQF